MSSVIKARYVVFQDATGEPTNDAGPTPPPSAARVAARALLDAAPLSLYTQRRLEAELDSARADAAHIRRQAEADRDALFAETREAAYAEGVAAGKDAGMEEARAAAKQRLQTLHNVTEQLSRTKQQQAREYEDVIVELALTVAARLVRDDETSRANTARRLLDEMIPRTEGARSVTVKLHPDDLHAIEKDVATYAGRFGDDVAVDWVGDDRLAPGDCVVETDRGRLDGRLETRVTQIVEALLGVMRDGG